MEALMEAVGLQGALKAIELLVIDTVFSSIKTSWFFLS